MSQKAPGQGTVAGDMSVADAVCEELWQGVAVGLGVSQSSERVFPQPSRQKAPGSQQEPSSRSPGTAPSLTSAPSLPQRLVMPMGAAKVPHGNRAGHPKMEGHTPGAKPAQGGMSGMSVRGPHLPLPSRTREQGPSWDSSRRIFRTILAWDRGAKEIQEGSVSSSMSWDTLRPVPHSPDFQEGATGASWPLMDFSFRNSLWSSFLFFFLFLSSCKHGMKLERAGTGGAGRGGEDPAGEVLRGSVSLAPCFPPLPFVEVWAGNGASSPGGRGAPDPCPEWRGNTGRLRPAPRSQGVPQSSSKPLLLAARGLISDVLTREELRALIREGRAGSRSQPRGRGQGDGRGQGLSGAEGAWSERGRGQR